MPRKTTILIVILAAVTGILIFLAVRSDTTQQFLDTVVTQDTPTPSIQQPYATLGFAPPSIDVSTTSSQLVDVTIDTQKQPVAGAQIELSYDPRVITNVQILPAPTQFFGENAIILINSVDVEQGRISYAVGIPPSENEKTGTGSVMRLSFTTNRAAGINSTQMTFLTKSAVTTYSSQGSVLQSSAPLQVNLTTPTTP